MIADVQKSGDAAHGEAIFRRRDQLCLRCHAIAGSGGQVGPDLSSVGASAPIDYLIDSVLLPNKAVKENYHATLVTTQQGLSYIGIKVLETPTTLVLRTADDKEVSIPIKDIDERKMGGSLMPDGLTDVLTHGQFVDLVKFLSELGKVGPYSVSKARLVRRWRAGSYAGSAATIAGIRRRGARRSVAALGAGLLHSGWSAAADGLATWRPMTAVVRCQVEASTPGPVVLRLNTAKGLRLWLDRKPVEVEGRDGIESGAGRPHADVRG